MKAAEKLAIQDYLDNVKDWRWRIQRAGHTFVSFAPLAEVYPTQLSDWCAGKRVPNLPNFCKVEKKLKELEAEKGVANG